MADALEAALELGPASSLQLPKNVILDINFFSTKFI